MTFVLFAKRVWSFLVHYWYVPLGLIVAIVLFTLTRDRQHLVDWSKALAQAGEEHRADVDAIQRAHADQQAADDAAIRRMEEVQRQVREEYERNERTLDDKTEKRVAEITKRLKDDPHAMAKEIEDLTGFRVIVL